MSSQIASAISWDTSAHCDVAALYLLQVDHTETYFQAAGYTTGLTWHLNTAEGETLICELNLTNRDSFQDVRLMQTVNSV